MKSYRLTPAAENDLFEIWTSVAGDNPDAANRVEAEMVDETSMGCKLEVFANLVPDSR